MRPIFTFFCLALCLPLFHIAAQTSANTLLIHDVRVFDGERILEHRDVLVENGQISRVGPTGLNGAPGPAVVEGRGRTLLPGLFDAHVHVPAHPEEALHQAAALGVTTVLDMFGGGEKLAAKKRIERADPPGMADMRAAGFGATAPGSPFAMIMRQLPPIAAAEEAQAWVDARIAEGSDYIKIIYDEQRGGPLSRETLGALVQAAHKRGKIVVVHVLSERNAREAIGAGADGLAHLFVGDSAGSGFGLLADEHHVFIVPTLTELYGLCGKPQGTAILGDTHLEPFIDPSQRKMMDKPTDPSRYHLCTATDQAMKQLIQAHVSILAGTDSAPPMQMGAFLMTGFGASLHAELKLLVDDGMTPVEALTAATSAPARAFGFKDRGLIRTGMRADMVLVEGDPSRDILATRNIVSVWKRGVRVQR